MLSVNILKFQTHFFLFSYNVGYLRAGIHKMLARMANREDPDQTASSDPVQTAFSEAVWSEEAVWSGSAPFV